MQILVCEGDSAGAGELTSSDGWRGNVKKQVRSFEGRIRTHDGFEGRMDQCIRTNERTNELSNACARLLVCQPAETRRLFRGSGNELQRIEYKHTFRFRFRFMHARARSHISASRSRSARLCMRENRLIVRRRHVHRPSIRLDKYACLVVIAIDVHSARIRWIRLRMHLRIRFE